MSTHRARELRTNQTPPERKFWQLLYTVRKSGYHFRRQVQIGPYYADFACHHAHLIVEIDGDTHGLEEQIARDEARTAYLQSRGYTVLRFTNADVMTNPEGVFLLLQQALAGRQTSAPPPLIPPRKGEGDD